MQRGKHCPEASLERRHRGQSSARTGLLELGGTVPESWKPESELQAVAWAFWKTGLHPDLWMSGIKLLKARQKTAPGKRTVTTGPRYHRGFQIPKGHRCLNPCYKMV